MVTLTHSNFKQNPLQLSFLESSSFAMGSHMSCLTAENIKETIQLIRCDGAVRILNKPISAAQIMQEFPEHLVCHSHSFYIREKTPALSPNDQLKLGNIYFLLPQHFLQSPLSLVSLASFISRPPPDAPLNPTARLSSPVHSIQRASALCQPFEIEQSNTGGGGLRIRLSTEFIIKLIEDGRLNFDERSHAAGRDSADDEERRLCSTRELQKDYAQLVRPKGQRWTPKLETIREKGMLATKYS